MRNGKTLREEQVPLRLGVDVRHAPLVAQDFHRLLEAGNLLLAGNLRQRRLCPMLQAWLLCRDPTQRRGEHQRKRYGPVARGAVSQFRSHISSHSLPKEASCTGHHVPTAAHITLCPQAILI